MHVFAVVTHQHVSTRAVLGLIGDQMLQRLVFNYVWSGACLCICMSMCVGSMCVCIVIRQLGRFPNSVPLK